MLTNELSARYSGQRRDVGLVVASNSEKCLLSAIMRCLGSRCRRLKDTLPVGSMSWSKGLDVSRSAGTASCRMPGRQRPGCSRTGLGLTVGCTARWPAGNSPRCLTGAGAHRPGGRHGRRRDDDHPDRRAARSRRPVRHRLGHHRMANPGRMRKRSPGPDREGSGDGPPPRLVLDRGEARPHSACRAAGRDLGEVAVIRLEATIVVARSDKQQARARLRDVRASSADGLVR